MKATFSEPPTRGPSWTPESLSELAVSILKQAGFPFAKGLFTAQVAWAAHRYANARQNAGSVLKTLLDVEEHFGPGSPQEAIVQTIVNCGPVPLESYPIPIEVWEALGFEVYTNGDGSHGAHIPMATRV